MRNPRTASGTVIRVVAATLALGLVVLVGASVGTETTAPTELPVSVGEALQSTPAMTAATAAVAAAAQTRRKIHGGGTTVTLTLERTDGNGSPVDPGTPISWRISAGVSAGGNDGLALISVDLVQNTLVDLLPGTPSAEMVNFDRPNGICNLDSAGTGSAFGGTPVAGGSGGLNLIQIGGAQNTFGVLGEAMGVVIVVTTDVGFVPAVIAEGTFNAPSLPGDYTLSLQNGIANVLDDLAQAPPPEEHWPVHEAVVNDLSSESFTFTVSGT